MNVLTDIKGERFGNLVALNPTNERHRKSVVWECQCDCGKKLKLSYHQLRFGHRTSCGCSIEEKKRAARYIEYYGILYTAKELGSFVKVNPGTIYKRWKEGLRDYELIHGKPRKKNNDVKCKYRDEDGTPIKFGELSKEVGVSRWCLMLRYFNGDRGEKLRRPRTEPGDRALGKKKTICIMGEELTFEEASQKYEIRVDTLKNRWYRGLREEALIAPKYAHRARLITIKDSDGVPRTFMELSKKYGIPITTLRTRWYTGKSGDKLFEGFHGKKYSRNLNGKRRRRPIYKDSNGTTYTIKELAVKTGLSASVIRGRWHRGKRGEALVAPVRHYESKYPEAANE